MLSCGSNSDVAKTFLLTGEFPPMQTGIARMMGEVTRRYPRGELLVSTGQHRDSQDSDVRFSGAVIDRLPVPSKALRNLAGLLFWSRRVASLARHHKPRFAWCDSIRPCTYPAKWMHERVGTRYGVFVHGGDLLKELHAIHHSRFARKTAKALLGGGRRRQQPVDARAGAKSVARARPRSARRNGAARSARHRSRAVPARHRHARGEGTLRFEWRHLGAHRRPARAI